MENVNLFGNEMKRGGSQLNRGRLTLTHPKIDQITERSTVKDIQHIVSNGVKKILERAR